MVNRKLTIDDVRRVAAKHGGEVLSDGLGGYEILAPYRRRWKDAEVQCYVLPLNGIEPEDQQDEIQRCIDLIQDGHEPYPGG